MNQDQKRIHIHIPVTIEQVAATLNGTGRLLTAKNWERAAIVYAFTRDGEMGRPVIKKVGRTSDFLSPVEFAALGIYGLRSDHSVRECRNNWKLAVENGWAVDVEPGVDAMLPTEEYPPTPRVNKFHDMLKSSAPVDEKVAAIRQVMERDPEVAERMDNDFIQRAGRDNTFLDRVKPEIKRELVERLTEDPDIADDWQTRAKVERALESGRVRQEQRIEGAIAGDPIGRKLSEMGAAIDLPSAVANATRTMDHAAEEIAHALRRIGPLEGEGFLGLRFYLERDLPAAREAHRRLGEVLERIDSYLGSGETDLDQFVTSVLRGTDR